MKLLIIMFKFHLKIIYMILKFIPTNYKKIVFISRQSNVNTLDFKLIQTEIKNNNSDYRIVTLTKKLNKTVLDYVLYYFHLYRQMYHLATSKTCIIDSYCICVSVLKHKKNLKVIQIWHALGAIKKFGYQTLDKESGHDRKLAEVMQMHQNYDYVVSGSRTMIPYFSEAFNVTANKFIPIGLPRIDYLINDRKQIKKRIYKKYPNIKRKKVILYVPTFRKNKGTHVSNLVKAIDFNDYNLIVKAHPGKNITLKNNKVMSCPEFSSIELLCIADYIITDYSAISIEASILDKPIYFYLYDYIEYEEKNGVNVDLNKEMPGCVFKKSDELIRAIKKEKYDMSLLTKFRNKYITNQTGNSAKLLAQLIIYDKLEIGSDLIDDKNKEKIYQTN